MKIDIPFTNKFLQIRKTKGSSMMNGNGIMNTTITLSMFTRVGTGDDGSRTERDMLIKPLKNKAKL